MQLFRRFRHLLPSIGIGSDLRLAARRLAAAPLFLAFAVASLSIGVAVPTTVYSTLYELMWRPVGVARQDSLVLLSSASSNARWRAAASLPDFRDLEQGQQSFSSIAAFTSFAQGFSAASVSEFVDIEAVSGRFFETVGVQPLLGRVLQPADDERSASVVVLGEQFWRRRLDAAPGIVGQAVRIGKQSFEVVGVVPASFMGLTAGGPRRADLWMPLASAEQTGNRPIAPADRDRRSLSIVGRLGSGRTIETSSGEMRAFGVALDSDHPIAVPGPADKPRVPARRLWSTMPVADRNPLPPIRVDLLLLGLVFLVLVVACTNLGNLLLSRGAERAHEFSVRRALGASRWRLVRELLAESVLIVIVAAAVTYPAIGGLIWLVTMEIPVGHGTLLIEPVLNVPAALVAAGALLASMLVFGLEPALALTRDTMNVQLSSEAGAAPPRRRRRQRAFIRWQVATSVCFFLMAAVLARLLIKEARHDSGIAIDELAMVTVHFSVHGWDEARARRAMERAQALGAEYRELRSVSVSSGLPYGLQMTPLADITTPDRPFVKGARAETAGVIVASPNIFSTLGVPIVHGRGFDDRDGPVVANVGVVSELTARRLFGTRDAVGRQLTYKLHYSGRDSPQTITIIGIARDTDVDRLMSRDDALIYLPFSQLYLPNLVVLARTSPGTTAFGAVNLLQAILRRTDVDLSAGMAGPVAWLAAGQWVAARAAGALATGLGLLTLILSMVGLYGVQSQLVAHRTREVGIRMALGALTAQIQRMVMREGFRPVAEGFALGLFFGTVARAGIRAMFEGAVDIVDPFAIMVVPVPLAIAAFLACYLPARRASRVDPNIALRHL